MEDILKYENRQKLYQFLLDDYGFQVKEEYRSSMGYYVDLISEFFLLRYYHDRLFLSIDIASLYDNARHLYDLSFIKDLIYNPDSINADEQNKDNATRINELNSFLQKDFKKISELLNRENYPTTKKRLTEGLEKQFYLKHPSARPKT